MDNKELILNDTLIECQDCGEKFVFTVGEQRYFRDKLLAPPKRCPACRKMRRIDVRLRGIENEK